MIFSSFAKLINSYCYFLNAKFSIFEILYEYLETASFSQATRTSSCKAVIPKKGIEHKETTIPNISSPDMDSSNHKIQI